MKNIAPTIFILLLSLILVIIIGNSESADSDSTKTNAPYTDTNNVEDKKEPDEWKLERVFENGTMKMYLVAPKEYGAKKWEVSAKDGNFIIAQSDSSGRCIVQLQGDETQPTGLWLADIEKDELTLLTGEQLVIDCAIHYDRLYWYNTNREVWVCIWKENWPNAVLFCEDALGVSHRSEGALVTPERANWHSNGIPIYSPFGIT